MRKQWLMLHSLTVLYAQRRLCEKTLSELTKGQITVQLAESESTGHTFSDVLSMETYSSP